MLQSCDGLGRLAEEVLDSLRRVTDESAIERHVIERKLVELRAEFGGFDWDRQRQTLSVVVGSIELQGIQFGRFEVVLYLGRLVERRPYEVIAVTPNSAAVDDQVTHPDVRGNMLCEGEGSAPIRLALDQGRLCDFLNS